MSSKHLIIFSWRLYVLAACLLVLPVEGACAADPGLLAADLSTHTSGPSLRPATDDDSASGSSSDATQASNSITAADPLPTTDSSAVPSASLPLFPPAPASAPAPGTDSTTEVAANNSAPANVPAASGSNSPSQNVTINLINLMVKRNLISRGDADDLIRQAQQEADLAKAQAVTAQATADRALAAQQAQPAPTPASASTSSDDEVRVAYVPDVVKKQITDQVTQNVMEQTREEHLADTISANEVPEWVKRFHVMGDVRIRYENDMFPSGNAVGNFTNFNAINTSASGLNANTANPVLPQENVDQNRNRFRLRARMGADIDLGDNFTSGMRIATGSDNNPVTENQTFGGANSGQGGDFSKYSIWLDRAFIRYDLGGQPDPGHLTATVGRFDNPFFSTSMMWADEIGFDGAVVKGTYQVAPGVTPFLTAGGFPVFNTDLNFSSDQSEKFQSEDKYLLATQGGIRWTINKDFSILGAAAYYDFENIQGKVSDPIFNAGLNAGNTDDSRPSFAQNGNTYIALRDYQDPTAIPDVTVENQYYGLATPFEVLSLSGQLDCSSFDPFHLSITGEYIENMAFDRNTIINNGPASNPGPQNNTTGSAASSFDGGNKGYMIHFDMGKVALEQLWDWNVRLSYRYVQTDATVDGFTDADFGATLTGTNLKGYTIGGNLALGQRVWTSLRFMSADNVSGPTFKNDLVQFDINAKF